MGANRITTYALFIDPPLGRVGMTEKQSVEGGYDMLVAQKPMSHVGWAIDKGETQGFLKFVVDARTQRFLGASVLGTFGDEIIASVTNLMVADAPYTVLQQAVHIHPTVTELVPTTLGALEPVEALSQAPDFAAWRLCGASPFPTVATTAA